ncbi:MAG: (2Fe-2S)-binding protein [Proteobacteria bacterium SG_bin5]|nr:(2Fe-2S)-binding protein [Sphingomonas sp.]OQW41755.1 MAG: (2Fe-2S)-binding protein [Proteobacteria bacterium SG_bin5]
MAVRLTVNGRAVQVDAPAEKPLLWVLREDLGLIGTKFGCGQGLCGACTVHLDGKAVRGCQTPLGSVGAAKVTTIEAVAQNAVGRRVTAAWIDADVPQCGYCQAGQIMSATALLARTPKPSDAEIDAAMAGNLCRCATYNRIRAAIRAAARA